MVRRLRYNETQGERGTKAMTVLVVLIMFAIFVSIDYLRHRGAEEAERSVFVPEPEATFRPEPVWVAGYQMPEDLHYHRGHTWVRPVGPDTAVVGLDDFARRLLGSSDEAGLPATGSWLQQGAKAVRLGVDGRQVDLVTPIEGEVVQINTQVAKQPGLASDDPYGRGWLFMVRTPALRRNLANLLSGSLARRFMEDSRERLQHQLMALSGTVLADGGEPATDFARYLPDEDWRQLVRDHLLS
jgi:glycine cleavage system H protein